jgi:hypothetical protein
MSGTTVSTEIIPLSGKRALRVTTVEGEVRCESLFVDPAAPIPLSELADWLLRAEKCMEPATVVMEFRCSKRHSGENFKCDQHAQDDGTQFCGYCANLGRREPVTIRVLRRF